MKTTKKQIQSEIAALKKIFSTVRLLSAEDVEKNSGVCEKHRITGHCYDSLRRNSACQNCISYRALIEKKQFSEIEKLKDGIFQVIADCREVDGKPCVLEMVKIFDEGNVVDLGDEDEKTKNLPGYFEKTYTDVLTQTYNRRYYEEYIAEEVLHGAIALIDLDDFKLYNDLFGHDIGDEVLKIVAAIIKKTVRSTDKVVRYGGDEFLVVLPDIEDIVLRRCLKEICENVKETVIKNYPAIKPSVSIGGIVCFGEAVKSAIKRADGFMYLAKKEKDCFVVDDKNNKEIKKQLSKKERVLIVDDSDINREILTDILKNEYDILEAKNGEEAISLIEKNKNEISVVLLDLIMPGMSGFDVLDYMNAHDLISDTPVITITGDESNFSMREAYEKGVSDYITRPFDVKVVYRRVSNTVKVFASQKALQSEVSRQTCEKEKNRDMIIEILSQVIEYPEGDHKGGHAGHIIEFTRLILQKLLYKTKEYGIKNSEIYTISTAAALHDIGKACIDRKILDKKGKLTAEEYEIMKKHTVYGERILKNIKNYADEPLIKYACDICRHHHERFDGGGYPDGLKGNSIPVAAQVVSICDAYDALVSERLYKKAYSHEQAVTMIKNGECGVFNPLILECFLENADKFKQKLQEEGWQ